jgi:hypothetical protein
MIGHDLRTSTLFSPLPPGEGPGVRVMPSLGQTLKLRRCRGASPRHGFTSDEVPSPQPSPRGRGSGRSVWADRRYPSLLRNSAIIWMIVVP